MSAPTLAKKSVHIVAPRNVLKVAVSSSTGHFILECTNPELKTLRADLGITEFATMLAAEVYRQQTNRNDSSNNNNNNNSHNNNANSSNTTTTASTNTSTTSTTIANSNSTTHTSEVPD